MFEDTCKDGDSDAYKCVYVIVQSRQKRKSVLLSHRKRRRTHIGLLFEFQRLKIFVLKLQFLKTCDHATDVVPRLGTSSWFCPGWSFCLSFTPRGGRHIKIAVTQMMKRYYCKQCILRHHEINDRTWYETIDFLFCPSDIYRHIAQPYFQTCINVLVLLNTKEDILKNVETEQSWGTIDVQIFFSYHGSQWCPKTAWLQTFFRISSFVFSITNTFIKVWSYLRVRIFFFGGELSL